ncbi:unnamed protein product [Cuscuta campestris]|uniref:Uncharacterized protein n=1 Tax=Cuscuta campestris TaxID=132261 RepID=A0A484MZ05_9ASTE|nr:unnamed protein product [Cuscuta campestris]
MNQAGPSCPAGTLDGYVVSVTNEEEWDEPRTNSGKGITKPTKTRDSALKRLGSKKEGPRKSVKLRLGPDTVRPSAFECHGGGRGEQPAQSRSPKGTQSRHLEEEEAESQPRAFTYTRLSYESAERDFDEIGCMARKLQALEDKGKIGSFEKLAEIFRRKYQDNCVKRKKFTYLNMVGQREKETLIQFLTRWREEMDKVEEIDDNTAMSLLMNAFRSREVYTEFYRRPSASYQETYNTAWEYGEADNLNQSNKDLEEGYKAKSSQAKREDQSGGSKSKTHHEDIVHEIRENKKRGQAQKALGGEMETFKKLKLDRSQLEPLQIPLSGFTRATIEAEGTITLSVELGTGSSVVSKRMKFVVVDIHCVHNAILGRPVINQVQATNEGASTPVTATIPVISAPVLPLGLSSIPTASVISPFATPVPSAGPSVTFPPSMTQFMNDPANLQAIQGFGQVMAMCQQNGGMPFLPGMFPFTLPGTGTMPLQASMAVTSFQTPMPQPSPLQPQLVSTMAPVNLTGALNAAGNPTSLAGASGKSKAKSRVPTTSTEERLYYGDGSYLWFDSEEERTRFLTFFSKRVVAPPRIIPERYPELQRYDDLDAQLHQAGLWPFVSRARKEINPALIRVFYSNLRREGDVLYSLVKSTPIELSIEQLGCIDGLPYQGDDVSLYGGEDWVLNNEGLILNELGITELILHASGCPTIHSANPDGRLLLYIVSRIIKPRKHGDTIMSGEDLKLIHAIMHSAPINWAKFVMINMTIDASTDHDHLFPYPFVVMDILERFKVTTTVGPLTKATKIWAVSTQTIKKRSDNTGPATAVQRRRSAGGPAKAQARANLASIANSLNRLHFKVDGMDGYLERLDKGTPQAFEDLKTYLALDIVVVKPEARETLYLYLGVTQQAVSSVPMRDDGIPRPIYYKEEEHEKVITESWWTMSVDGASRLKGYGGGVVFNTLEGFEVYHALIFKFKLTNNEAEYEALVSGLRLAKTLHVSHLVIKSDSSQVVGHVNENIDAKGEKIQKYRDLVRALLRDMEEYKFEQIPRGQKTYADLLSKLTQETLEHVSKLAKIDMVERPSIELKPINLVMELDRVGPGLVQADDFWMTDLVKYLVTGQLSEEDDRSCKVKLSAPRFQLLEGKLYKRSFGVPLLRCLTKSEAERVVAEVHEGVCAAHQMSRTLAQRIIMLGYYWPTMNMDCERFGLDIMGAFPVAQGSKKYVVVAIDSFTKWVEAEAYATITTKQCQKFVWQHIITQFGAPRSIVTDNGP